MAQKNRGQDIASGATSQKAMTISKKPMRLTRPTRPIRSMRSAMGRTESR